MLIQQAFTGTSLPVQWLRLRTSTAGGEGSIPSLGTKILHTLWQPKTKFKKQNKQKTKQNKNNKHSLKEWKSVSAASLPAPQAGWQTSLWQARRTGCGVWLVRTEAVQQGGFPCGSGVRLPWLRAWPGEVSSW